MLTAFALVQEVSAAARIQVTGNFAMVEPLTDQEYVVTEYDIPATATNYSVTWTFVGLQSTATLEYDNRSTSPLMTKWKAKKAQWSNTPNGFGIHAVYAVMTYKVGTTTYSLTSPTLQVQVKHIGSIGTLNVAGTNYTNGQYRNQACGGSTLALSVPAAATDPFSAVNYTWTFPSGWSPASITTTSTSVSVNSNVAGGGTIKVEAKRVDGTTKTSILLNITRPLPTVPTIPADPLLLCSSTTITATASNATSYNWVTTGGVSVSGSGSTVTLTGTTNVDGTVKVSATSSSCGVTTGYSYPRNIKRTAPLPESLLVTANGGGSPDFMCNGFGLSLNANTGEPGTTFTSWAVSDPVNTYFNYSGGTSYFNSYVNSCYGITVQAGNCFGSVQKGITICVGDCYAMMSSHTVYPNPASDVIHVAFESDESEGLPETIKLYSEKDSREVKSISTAEMYQSQDFKANKVISIAVSDLPKGTYYLQMTKGKGSTNKHRIILK